jgi:hypothetical protein
MPVSITTDEQFANVTLKITNESGQDAPIDGMPIWASSDETVLRVTPTGNSMSAIISSVAPGTARVSVVADANLGEGVTPITGHTEDITVTLANNAINVILVLGEPSPKNP